LTLSDYGSLTIAKNSPFLSEALLQSYAFSVGNSSLLFLTTKSGSPLSRVVSEINIVYSSDPIKIS